MPDEVFANVYVAGATEKDGRLLTSGGRVLGVTATASDLKTAIACAYDMVKTVEFENSFYRSDIGARALQAVKED